MTVRRTWSPAQRAKYEARMAGKRRATQRAQTPKRGPGRPRSTADGRTETISIRLSKAELSAAERRAEAAGLALAEWVRGRLGAVQ